MIRKGKKKKGDPLRQQQHGLPRVRRATCPVVVPPQIKNIAKATALVAQFEGTPEQELEIRRSGLPAPAMDYLEGLLDRNTEWPAEQRMAIADYKHSGGIRTRRSHEAGNMRVEHIRKTEIGAVPIAIRHGPGEGVHMPRRCRRSFFRDGFRIDLTRDADRTGGVEVEVIKPRTCPTHTAASLLLKVAGFCVDDGTVIAA